ncbi:hypothetical protein GOQ27_01150 [Clostridium sp. D2Q-11]|uniref:Uncharacterized protein n=1 Tax=Anaeromonas frigoriresistens TaxID=2683708 RepID=A0A942UYZ3_9FIRM|nr:hypothetical protein [Anaeromonas frigoriresistens]MBS4537047.1 hypothetical protein [Anaeromonas frigoriresistens]
MKYKKVLIIGLLFITVTILINLTDDKQTFSISSNRISEFNTNEMMSKLTRKLNIQNEEDIYITRMDVVSHGETEKFAGDYAFNISIEGNKISRIIWNMAVKRSSNNYENYGVIITKDKVTIHKSEDTNTIGDTEIKLVDAMDCIEKVTSENIINKWQNAHTYRFDITGIIDNENKLKNTKSTYIAKDDELFKYNENEELVDFENKVIDLSLMFFNNNGQGNGSTISILVNVDNDKYK